MMSDHAKKMTKQLQAAFPADPASNHFCKGDEMLPTIASVATRADDYRNVAKTTADWHFLDVPLGTPVGDGTGFYAMGCITTAVSQTVRDPSKRPELKHGAERRRAPVCSPLPRRYAPALTHRTQ
jgi:hypothetical protein